MTDMSRREFYVKSFWSKPYSKYTLSPFFLNNIFFFDAAQLRGSIVT